MFKSASAALNSRLNIPFLMDLPRPAADEDFVVFFPGGEDARWAFCFCFCFFRWRRPPIVEVSSSAVAEKGESNLELFGLDEPCEEDEEEEDMEMSLSEGRSRSSLMSVSSSSSSASSSSVSSVSSSSSAACRPRFRGVSALVAGDTISLSDSSTRLAKRRFTGRRNGALLLLLESDVRMSLVDGRLFLDLVLALAVSGVLRLTAVNGLELCCALGLDR
jgi:hypothetical protein